MWIKIEDELPIQNFQVKVKNGKSIVWARYRRKKWHWWNRKLHNVTEWWKCPVVYPKIPMKDLNAFVKRAQKYKNQMQPKKFRFGPPVGLYGDPPMGPVVSDEEAIASLRQYPD